VSCSHISRVKEWGIDDNHNYIVTLWDCLVCNVESDRPFLDQEFKPIDHSKCNYDPCFGCKAKGLQLNTGDASSQKIMSNKKWDGELNEYRKARAQGIQPAGTTMAAIQDAYRASEVMGKAYDADTMTKADTITKQSVSSLKEAGAI